MLKQSIEESVFIYNTSPANISIPTTPSPILEGNQSNSNLNSSTVSAATTFPGRTFHALTTLQVKDPFLPYYSLNSSAVAPSCITIYSAEELVHLFCWYPSSSQTYPVVTSSSLTYTAHVLEPLLVAKLSSAQKRSSRSLCADMYLVSHAVISVFAVVVSAFHLKHLHQQHRFHVLSSVLHNSFWDTEFPQYEAWISTCSSGLWAITGFTQLLVGKVQLPGEQ